MSTNTSIPFLDLVTPHVELERELTDVFHKTLRTAGFIGGPMVDEFEKAFASFCDAKFAIGVGSGTDAVRFALMACGVKSGDVVVTVPNTLSRPPKRFPKPERCPSSSTSTSAPTTWIRHGWKNI